MSTICRSSKVSSLHSFCCAVSGILIYNLVTRLIKFQPELPDIGRGVQTELPLVNSDRSFNQMAGTSRKVHDPFASSYFAGCYGIFSDERKVRGDRSPVGFFGEDKGTRSLRRDVFVSTFSFPRTSNEPAR
ncbi:hypothetical protein AVEN_155559-1 [Araneus ventricosus]|uniref:Uncharacterized protein n=1 Tax=Araneus ventricosus TaxID=182803 RepID=A0A4Y2PUJ4_ARAVE|nr:hypothetical protein AVEN_155559-1 [Araneus ventricosus]